MSRSDPAAARWGEAEDTPAEGDSPDAAAGTASTPGAGAGAPDAPAQPAADAGGAAEPRGIHGVAGAPGTATGAAPGGTPGGTPGTGAILTDVAALTAERDDYLQSLQRLKADFDNYRKRVARLQEEQAGRAAAALVQKLLPVLDNLDLAVAHLVQDEPATEDARALAQARDQLLDVLGKEGLERVDAVEVAFDPTVHDAVAHAEATPKKAPADAAADAPAAAPAAAAPDGAGRPGTAPTAAPAPDAAAGAAPGGDGAGTEASAAAEPAAPVDEDGGAAAGPASHEVVVDEVMRAGYRWRGQVVRPAMVRVRG